MRNLARGPRHEQNDLNFNKLAMSLMEQCNGQQEAVYSLARSFFMQTIILIFRSVFEAYYNLRYGWDRRTYFNTE